MSDAPHTLRGTLADEAAAPAYRWVYRPMLLGQLALYLRALARFAEAPAYAFVGSSTEPLLYENHLGNWALMRSAPEAPLLAVHLGMAAGWIGGLLIQKQILAGMARSLAGQRPDAPGWRRYRRLHAIVGTSMCALALAGCVAGPTMAWRSHGDPPMRTFLLMLPLFFVPSIALTWWSGRSRARFSIRSHQAIADVAFLAPAIASLWAEALIWSAGHLTPLGPAGGERAGTGLAYALAFAAFVLPALRRWSVARGPA